MESVAIQLTSQEPVEAEHLGITPAYAYLFEITKAEFNQKSGISKKGEPYEFIEFSAECTVIKADQDALPVESCRGKKASLRISTGKGEAPVKILNYTRGLLEDCKIKCSNWGSTETIIGEVVSQTFVGFVKERNDFCKIQTSTLRQFN